MPACGGECSIASHQFLDIQGPGDGSHPQSRVITRPGLPGGEVWRTPLQAIPFVLKSVVDTTSKDQAYREHKKYVDTHYLDDLQQIVWRGVDIGSVYDVLYFIHDVRIINVFDIGESIGGLNPPSNAMLICEWTVVPFNNY